MIFRLSFNHHLLTSRSLVLIICCNSWKHPQSPYVHDVIILSQQSYILEKLFFSPQSLPKSFFYFTRVSSSYPLELKLIELICALPDKSFPKILLLFLFQLRTLKSSFQKSFDICLLQFLASNSSPSITLPLPALELFGILFSTDPDLIFQTSQDLAELSLSHTMHNKLQAKFSEKMNALLFILKSLTSLFLIKYLHLSILSVL